MSARRTLMARGAALAALMLLAAGATHPVRAEEAGLPPAAHGDAATQDHAGTRDGAPAARDDHGRDEHRAGAGTAHAAPPPDNRPDTPGQRGQHFGRAPAAAQGTAPPGPIDAHIPPRIRPPAKPEAFPRPRSAVRTPVVPRHQPPGGAAGPARNAIGIAVNPPMAAPLPKVSRPPVTTGLSTGVKNATTGATPGNAAGGVVHQGTGIPVARPNGINGTGFARPGSAPGSLGGAAHVTNGINGTNLRPRPGY
jgi:hypothetical protein